MVTILAKSVKQIIMVSEMMSIQHVMNDICIQKILQEIKLFF
jgi:hypothetical protein